MLEPDNHRKQHRRTVYSYENERKKRTAAYFLLISGLFIFFLTLIGATDGISVWTQDFLLSKLGYTNKWSGRFGPSWFVHILDDFSAFGSKVVLLIATVFVAGYYKLKNKLKRLWKFLIVVIGGGILMLIIKLMFAEETPYDPSDLLISSIANFPSGHAMISIIFYLTLAVLVSRKQRKINLRIYTLISASVLIFIIGLSRVLGASHSVTEVLAGWSAGIVWLCLCWFTERYMGKKLSYQF